jgi:predicted ATPase/DNA-binding SARP family transcriptional activator
MEPFLSALSISSEAGISGLSIRLFGRFEVEVDGLPLPKTRSRKERWLLALLVLERGRPVSRAQLAQTLWPFPDHPADLAAYNLRRSLAELRRALGRRADRLQSPTPRTLALNLEGAEVDLLAFDTALFDGDAASLARAVALYRGPLLSECNEAWALRERTKREQDALKALEELSARAMTAGDYEAAIGYLRRAVAADPLRERAQRALMEALAKSGDHNAAIQTYQQLSRLLLREQNAVPDAETTALFHALRSELRNRSRKEPIPPSPSPPVAPRHLPVPLTTLVGREEQIRGIETRLRLVRLLTLTGSGGVGKTRLAVQIAESLAEDDHDGVWFVDLSSLTDPSLVPQTVAFALEVREEVGHTLTQTLIRALQSRQLLLVLDGCEHLVSSCARLVESLLQGCRHLRILATSRQPLGVAGETVWRVPSLSLPDPSRLPAADRDLPPLLMDYAAIRLFVERAALVQPDFQLTPHNARAVAQVCLRLDGIPLAIELAAARVKALPVEQIARRFNQLFRLLTGGPRSALSRQQTMEATIRWSYDLLSEPERRLLCRLSVFAGNWTLEAAEAVCGEAVLDLLSSLIDRSMVVYEPRHGEGRYRLLETVRQYGRERLAEFDEAEPLGDRHLHYYLQRAEEAAPTLFGPEAEPWLNLLEAEHDNLRAALEWALTGKHCGEEALRLTAALWRFWHRRGYLSEGRGWLTAALSASDGLGRTAARAGACNGAGFLAFHQGEVAAARLYLDEALSIAGELGDRALIAAALHSQGYMAWYWNDLASAHRHYESELAIHREAGNRQEVARTLCHLGIIAGDRGDTDLSRLYFEESLTIAREVEDRALVATCLHSQGHTAVYRRDYAAARALYAQVLALGREMNDRTRVATALHRLGSVAYVEGDFAAARRHLEESLAVGRALEEKTLIAAALHHLGLAIGAQGERAPARSHLAESLALYQELRDNRGIALVLDACAGLAVAQGQERRAALLLGAADALREAVSSPARPSHRAEGDPTLLAARVALGDTELTTVLDKGRALTLADAIATALED